MKSLPFESPKELFMSRFLRAFALVSLPVVVLAGASAQDDTNRPRLPNNWKALELTDQQKEQYYRMSGAREKQIEALKTDINELQTKLTAMRKQLKELDDGDTYLTILTAEQKDKLAKIRTESAKKSAEKAAAKAKEMERTGGKAPKVTKTTTKKETPPKKEKDAKKEATKPPAK
jgi:septal ring factor EnvC (AmiA/AmiB activator)